MDEKPRILGVDDSLTIRKALEIVLKPAGYVLDLAGDGAEALEKAKSFKPALILLDFILPDMRGTEVCRRLADDPETAHIPVVLISAKGAEIRQAYQDIGNVVSYIAKPFKPQVVTSIVAEVLAKGAAGELVKSTMSVHEAPALPGTPPAAAVPVMTPPPAPISVAPEFTSAAMPAATNGGAYAYSADQIARANGHDDLEEIESDERVDAAIDTGLNEAARREMLEVMFETLRAGLEGVYVEEVDTATGAAADEAASYTGLMERLGNELTEALQHARSGARYTLYSDGSVRSLDETLLDTFRRSCRLLFRAVVAGAVENEMAPSHPRILVACHRDSAVHQQIRSLLSAHPDWQVFTISEGFRQLPMMTRLYGPTYLIAETTWSGALWDQLRNLQRLPEARAMTVIGLADASRATTGPDDPAARAAALSERGIATVLRSAFELEHELGETPITEAPALLSTEAPTLAPATL